MFRIGIVGCGLKAVEYLDDWLGLPDPLSIPAIFDVSEASVERCNATLAKHGQPPARSFTTLQAFVEQAAGELDAAYISTPHTFHAEYAETLLRAGLDILLEKPMAGTFAETSRLLTARNETGKTLQIAYQGSLSPLFAHAQQLIDSGDLGELRAVNGSIWEGWREKYQGHWKQKPDLSQGGFCFDTGSHLMNAVCHLCTAPIQSVAAQLDKRGTPLDIIGSVQAEFVGGIPLNLTFCGDSGPYCKSALSLFFARGHLRIDAWGRWLEIETASVSERLEFSEESAAMLETFRQVRTGAQANPSPPETSLHIARLWDAINLSAERAGEPVTLQQ